MKRFAIGLALIGISTAIGLYIVEGSLLLLGDVPSGFDRRSVLQVVEASSHETRTFPAHSSRFFPTFGDLFPLGGMAHSRIVMCNENGAWETYTSDRYGFNNPDGVWDGPVDVATVGDSFTHGNCLPAAEHFVGRLRTAGKRVLNVGKAGIGPLAELGILMEYVAPMKPARVVWFVSEPNDPEDLHKERQNPVLMRYLKGQTQNLAARQSEIEAHLLPWLASRQSAAEDTPGLTAKTADFLTVGTLRRRLSPRSLFPNPWAEGCDRQEEVALLTEILKTAKGAVESWGGRLELAYLPEVARYSQSAYKDLQHLEAFRHEVHGVANALSLPLHDMVPTFDRQTVSLSSLRGPHYSSEANRLIAEALLP